MPPARELLDAVRAELDRQGAALDEPALLAFLVQLDPSYFERERPQDIALHARLSAELGRERRARLAVTPREGGRYDVAVVAFDYFAELSILCGLFAARGLDIESGHVHTLVPAPGPAASPPSRRGREARPAAGARRIVDVFRVRPRTSAAPDAPALESELGALLDLVADGRGPEARERIHLSLVEALEDAVVVPPPRSGVEIRFEGRDDERFTTMAVTGPDAPGFLYSLTNALAMRGIYVHEVQIDGAHGQVRDRFRITRSGEGTRLSPAEEEALRTSVVLIWHFTYLLPAAPDPARALRYFDQLLDRAADAPELLAPFRTAEGLHDLARFLGSSAYLWEDLVRDRVAEALPLLASFRSRSLRGPSELRSALAARRAAAPPGARSGAFRAFRDEERLIVETKRLLDPFMALDRFSWALSDLGEALVAEALEEALAPAPAPRPGLAALGLGKFGGREMGHASDLELLFVHADPAATGGEDPPFDEIVRTALGLLEAPEGALFHVDLRLRPHGSKGSLAAPLGALRGYYRPGGEAAPFERQALIKLRFVAGDALLGREVERLRDEFVWSGEPWDREASVRLRERQARELVPAGRFNVKMSRGGLVDAEYAVQYLQVQHGAEHPLLRTPATLPALDRLRTAGILEAEEHAQLRAGYLFWREVADALRVVRGHAGDLLMPDEASDDYGFLARRLGYAGGRRAAADALRTDAARHRQQLASLYDRRFRG